VAETLILHGLRQGVDLYGLWCPRSKAALGRLFRQALAVGYYHPWI
jgi:hypothetical protein